MHPHTAARTLALALLATGTSPVIGDTIFSTGDPYGGPLGVTGYDVWSGQSVAIRFCPDHECTLDSVSLWVMSNAPVGEPAPVIAVSVRTDMNPGSTYTSVPSEVVLEWWTRGIAASGHSPVLETFNSVGHAVLHAGQQYWLVAESDTPTGHDPVWNWSGQSSGFVATNHGPDTAWGSRTGFAVAAQVEASPAPACGSADFNHDGDAATDLDIEEFFRCIAGNCCGACGSSDFNGDGDAATDADIEAFFRVLAGGTC